ncbi:MAG: hypothetical protein K9L17_09750 [Clostridiales bacterium]|nr:hypothetical protein [Clostridiales bacterium]MCF8022963.1 hypothetical protein [Clostridiales bacterium]
MIPEEIKISKTQIIKIYQEPQNNISTENNWVAFIGEDKENTEEQAIYINSDNGPLTQMQGFLHRLMELGCLVLDQKKLMEDDYALGQLAAYMVMLINNNKLDLNIESQE